MWKWLKSFIGSGHDVMIKVGGHTVTACNWNKWHGDMKSVSRTLYLHEGQEVTFHFKERDIVQVHKADQNGMYRIEAVKVHGRITSELFFLSR